MSILNEDLSTCEPWTKDLCFEVYVSTYLVLEGVFCAYAHVCACSCVQVHVRVYEGHTCGGPKTSRGVAP